MSEHRHNPVAQANSGPRETVNLMDLGEGVALLGVHIVPAIDKAKDELVILINAIGGHLSPIVGGFTPRPTVLCEIARAPLSALRKVFKGGAASVDVPEPGTMAPPEAAPPVTSGLVIVP